MKETRKGKGNPAYRNGTRINGKSNITHEHLKACKDYRREFLKKNDYIFCEVCGANSNATLKHEVHHIYFASRFPRHKELHNPKNLVMVCIECHNKFHAGNNLYKKEFEKLEKERDLKKLFNPKKS